MDDTRLSAALRQDVIREELAAVARGQELPGSTSLGGSTRLRGRVRRLIAHELEAMLASGLAKDAFAASNAGDFVRDCMMLKEFREAQGTRALTASSQRSGMSRARSSPALSEQLPPMPEYRQHVGVDLTRQVQYLRSKNGGFVKDALPWQVSTKT
ncbi:unnamed protein product, partial [Polarella glacialis]